MKIEKFPGYEGLLDGFRKESKGDGGAHYVDAVVLRDSLVLRGEHAAPYYEDTNPRFTLKLGKGGIEKTENMNYFLAIFDLLIENTETEQRDKIKRNKPRRGK
jgi:hypothetical protein